MFEKEIIIDGRGHLCGRLASIVAAQLLRGQRVVVVRCEEILRSGSIFRNKLIWQERERKRINTNPRRGFKHALAPSRMFWKNIRGMLPHKEARGAAALASLRLFDGIPYPYDQKKRMVVPNALKVLRMKSHRNFTSLREIAKLAGWSCSDLIDTLETRRKAKSAKFYAASQARAAAKASASGDKSVAAFNGALTKLGF